MMHSKTVFLKQRGGPHIILSLINELFVRICLHKIKPVYGRILTDTLQKFGGNVLSSHLRCNRKAEYRFYLYGWSGLLCWNIPHKPPPAVAFQAIHLCIGIAPSHDLIITISEIALYVAILDVFYGTISSFFR